VEAAASVRDHEDLARPEELLAHHERTDRILRCEAAGVPDDVGIADAQPERVLDVDACVHAGDDRQTRQGRRR
jgi:hypothetical protein